MTRRGVFADGWRAYGPEPQPLDWQRHDDLAHALRSDWRLLGPIPPVGYKIVPDADLASALGAHEPLGGAMGRGLGPTGELHLPGRSASFNEQSGSPN